MEPTAAEMTDRELVDSLRRAAGIWFKNTDLLLLEELIRRYGYALIESASKQRVHEDDNPG